MYANKRFDPRRLGRAEKQDADIIGIFEYEEHQRFPRIMLHHLAAVNNSLSKPTQLLNLTPLACGYPRNSKMEVVQHVRGS
jgi:hypothetical protein